MTPKLARLEELAVRYYSDDPKRAEDIEWFAVTSPDVILELIDQLRREQEANKALRLVLKSRIALGEYKEALKELERE